MPSRWSIRVREPKLMVNLGGDLETEVSLGKLFCVPRCAIVISVAIRVTLKRGLKVF